MQFLIDKHTNIIFSETMEKGSVICFIGRISQLILYSRTKRIFRKSDYLFEPNTVQWTKSLAHSLKPSQTISHGFAMRSAMVMKLMRRMWKKCCKHIGIPMSEHTTFTYSYLDSAPFGYSFACKKPLLSTRQERFFIHLGAKHSQF